jgi:hypothetical protein
MGITAIIIAVATRIKDLVRPALDFMEVWIPFRLEIGVSGDPATVYVFVTNYTKDRPLFIRQVRIHFGQPHFTHSLILEPRDTQQIAPRASREFIVSCAVGSRVGRRVIVHQSKYHPGLGDAFPSFEHPVQLFHAIANGPKNSSWIEIDFNEFRKRRFRRGKMKPLFQRAVEKWKYEHNKQAP